MAISGLKVGTTPPEDERLMYFNTDNNTLNFFNPDTKEWDKCRGVYADENPESPDEPEEPEKTIPYPITDTTKLLLHFEDDTDSSNYHNTLTFGGTQDGNYSLTISKFGYGYASGWTNDQRCILIPSQNIVFGANDFTIDWWQDNTNEIGAIFCSKYADNASSIGGLMIGYGDGLVYASSGTGSWNLVNGVKMIEKTSEWTHWAIVRSGTTLTSYKNGTQYAQTTINGAIGQYPDDMVMFGYYKGSNDSNVDSSNTKIDEFRIVIGEAVWTSDFTPPNHPYNTPIGETGAIPKKNPNKVLPNIEKPINGSARLLLHGDSFEDDSYYNVPINNVGVTISDKSRYPGGKSFYFDGNSRIEIPSDIIDFGREFYIEWWEYVESATPGTVFSNNYSSPSNQWGGLLIGYTNRAVYAGTDAATWNIVSGESYAEGQNGNWRHYRFEVSPHVAYNRVPPTIRCYYDQTKDNIIDTTNSTIYKKIFCPDGAVMAIGQYQTIEPAGFTGYIQDFMISQQGISVPLDERLSEIIKPGEHNRISEIPFNTSLPENFGYLFDAENAHSGFIGIDGTIRTPGEETKEVYSDYFPVPAYPILKMDCFGAVDNNYLWMCVEYTDSTYKLLSRPAFQLETATGNQKMSRISKIPDGVSFVRFSYRKFNDAKLRVTNYVITETPFDDIAGHDSQNWGYINSDGTVTYERDERSSIVSELLPFIKKDGMHVTVVFIGTFTFLDAPGWVTDAPNRNFDHVSATIAFYDENLQMIGETKKIQSNINMDDPDHPEIENPYNDIDDIPLGAMYWRASYTSWGTSAKEGDSLLRNIVELRIML